MKCQREYLLGKKLRHSLGRPSRSGLVQLDFESVIQICNYSFLLRFCAYIIASARFRVSYKEVSLSGSKTA